MASAERAALVLELVRGLVAEVHPHASRLTVSLDSSFEDLGIGSLELVELLLRVQDARDTGARRLCKISTAACARSPGRVVLCCPDDSAPHRQ